MSLHLFTLKQNLIHQKLCHERYTCLPVFVRTDLSVLRVKLLHSKLEAPRDSPVNQSSNPVFTINDVWNRLCQDVFNLITRFEGESVYSIHVLFTRLGFSESTTHVTKLIVIDSDETK